MQKKEVDETGFHPGKFGQLRHDFLGNQMKAPWSWFQGEFLLNPHSSVRNLAGYTVQGKPIGFEYSMLSEAVSRPKRHRKPVSIVAARVAQ